MSESIDFQEPAPERRLGLKKGGGWGEGQKGAIKAPPGHWLNRINNPETKADLRGFSDYVGSSQVEEDTRNMLAKGDQMINSTIDAVTTDTPQREQFQNPMQVARQKAWAAEVDYKFAREKAAKDAEEYGDYRDETEPAFNMDDAIDRAVGTTEFRPAAQEEAEDAFEHESQDDEEEPEVYGAYQTLDESIDATFAQAGIDVTDPDAKAKYMQEQAELAARAAEQEAQDDAAETTVTGSQEFSPPSEEAMDSEAWGQ